MARKGEARINYHVYNEEEANFLRECILADAICDRIVHDSYSLIVEGKESMRKRKGIPENT